MIFWPLWSCPLFLLCTTSLYQTVSKNSPWILNLDHNKHAHSPSYLPPLNTHTHEVNQFRNHTAIHTVMCLPQHCGSWTLIGKGKLQRQISTLSLQLTIQTMRLLNFPSQQFTHSQHKSSIKQSILKHISRDNKGNIKQGNIKQGISTALSLNKTNKKIHVYPSALNWG